MFKPFKPFKHLHNAKLSADIERVLSANIMLFIVELCRLNVQASFYSVIDS